MKAMTSSLSTSNLARARQLASGFDGRVQFAWGDITNPDSLRSALEGVDAVIHLAAIIPPATERMPDLAQKVNVDATRNLVAEMAGLADGQPGSSSLRP